MEKRIQIPVRLYEMMVDYIQDHYDPSDQQRFLAIRHGIEAKHDAEIFHKLASFTVVDDEGGEPFIPNNGVWGNDNYKSDEEYGIRYDELLWMQELRLINLNNGLQISFKQDGKISKVEATLKCGNLIIKISADDKVEIPCYSYTRIGTQLHTLIEDITPNKLFFEDRLKNRYSSDSTKIDFYQL